MGWGARRNSVLRVKKEVLVPLRVFSLLRSRPEAFAVTGDNVLLCYVCFTTSWGRKKFKPRPQNRILIPFRGFFQNLERALPSPLYRCSPRGRSTLLYSLCRTSEVRHTCTWYSSRLSRNPHLPDCHQT